LSNQEIEETTGDRLSQAKIYFAFVNDHASSLDDKARTLLTIVSLLIGTGVLTFFKATFDSQATLSIRLAFVVLELSLLATSAVAFFKILNVLRLHGYKGPPDAKGFLEKFRTEDAKTTRESLAHYYAAAAAENSEQVNTMASCLKEAFIWTKVAFGVFLLSIVTLTLAMSFGGEPKMSNQNEAPKNPASGTTSGQGSQPTQPASSAPPEPKPVPGTRIEKSDTPGK